jgi:hypothetical protein
MNFKKLLVGLFLSFEIGAPCSWDHLSEYLSPEHLQIAQSTQGLERIKAEARGLLQKLGPNLAPGCIEESLDLLAEKITAEFDKIMKAKKEINPIDSTSLRKLFDVAQLPLRKIIDIISPYLGALRDACGNVETARFLEEVLSAQDLGGLAGIREICNESNISWMGEYNKKAGIVRNYAAHQIVGYYDDKAAKKNELTEDFSPTLEEAELFLNSYYVMTEFRKICKRLMPKREDYEPSFASFLTEIDHLPRNLLGVEFTTIMRRMAANALLPGCFSDVREEYIEAIINALEIQGLDAEIRKAILFGRSWARFSTTLKARAGARRLAVEVGRQQDELALSRRWHLIEMRKSHITCVAKELLKSLDGGSILDELRSDLDNPLKQLVELMYLNVRLNPEEKEPCSIIRATLPFLEEVKARCNAEFLAALEKKAQISVTKDFIQAVLLMRDKLSAIEEISSRSELEDFSKYAKNELKIKDHLIQKIVNKSLSLEEARLFVDGMLAVLTLTTILSERLIAAGCETPTIYDDWLSSERFVFDKLYGIQKQLKRILDKAIPTMHYSLLPIAKSGHGVERSVLKRILKAYEEAGFDPDPRQPQKHQIQQPLFLA